MAKTFFALLKIADLDHPPQPQAVAFVAAPAHPEQIEAPNPVPRTSLKAISAPGLHYNIQIHLPATKDVEVYNAIFKSLKEHLIG